jgi:hypothetical protein
VRVGVHFDSLSCQILQKIMYVPSVRLRAVFYLIWHVFQHAWPSIRSRRRSRNAVSQFERCRLQCVISAPLFLHFGDIWTSFAMPERHVKARTGTRHLIKSGPQNSSPKSFIFSCFLCLAVKVRQGGPKGSFWCPMDGGPKGPPRTLKVSPMVQKWSPTVIASQQKSIKA